MIGTPNKLEVRVSRKLSDGEYGSMEISASLEVNLGPNDNPENAFDGADLWLTAKIAKSLAEKQAEAKHGQVVAPKTPEVVAQAAQAQPAAVVAGPVASGVAPEPTRVPIDDDGNEYKDIVVDHIKVIFSEEGEKRARTFGKPWMQYGAITYPETLAAVGFDLEASAGGVHQLPKPYTKARVLLGEKNAKGFDVPKKVVAFLE